MTGEGLESKSEKIAAIRELISKEGKPLKDTLVEVAHKARFLLVGENHTEHALLQEQVIKALPELKTAGFTHISFEVNRENQKAIDALNFNGPVDEVMARLKQERRLFHVFWRETDERMLIAAKQLGFKVLFINDPPEDTKISLGERGKEMHYDSHVERSARMNRKVYQESQRDKRMYDDISSVIEDSSRVLVIIGSSHVAKSPKEANLEKTAFISRLGSLLTDSFGKDKVVSFRYAFSGATIDDAYGSGKPTPRELSEKPALAMCLPDKGLVEGDSRITDSDYVVFPY